MTSFSKLILRVALVIWILPLGLTGCKASSNESSRAANQPAVVSADTSNPSQTADDAPPPEKTGGFDGKRAFAHVAKQVGFGPRPSGSPAIAQVQEYLLSELKSYGSSQTAARLSTNGDLKKSRAFLLADIVGGRKARFLRESSSTPALVDLVWNTAAKLGYSGIFLNDATSAQDDHESFLKRGVP